MYSISTRHAVLHSTHPREQFPGGEQHDVLPSSKMFDTKVGSTCLDESKQYLVNNSVNNISTKVNKLLLVSECR